MRSLLLFLALALITLPAAAATAAPADRDAALAVWKSVQHDQQVDDGWTGSVDTCTVGTESAASLNATLHAVNALRDFAGVAPVSFDDGLNHKALAAALMMRAKGDVSHDPPPDWPCYSDDGHDGAGHSNLALGASGAGAVVLYSADEGLPELGHRRWLLDPNKNVFGSGSTGVTNALYTVTGPGVAVPPGTQVAWPPGGFFPRELVPSLWSIAIGGSGQTVEFQNPQVTMTLDGDAVAVDGVKDIGSGFGTGRTLAWRPTLGSSLDTGDHDVGVTISGVVVDGRPFPVSYTAKVVNEPEPGPGAGDALRFLSGPVIRRRDGKHRAIRRGVRLVVRAKVAGGSVTRYRWLRDGRRIKRATTKTYRVRGADRGHRLSCRVTATASGGTKLTRTTKRVRVARR